MAVATPVTWLKSIQPCSKVAVQSSLLRLLTAKWCNLQYCLTNHDCNCTGTVSSVGLTLYSTHRSLQTSTANHKHNRKLNVPFSGFLSFSIYMQRTLYHIFCACGLNVYYSDSFVFREMTVTSNLCRTNYTIGSNNQKSSHLYLCLSHVSTVKNIIDWSSKYHFLFIILHRAWTLVYTLYDRKLLKYFTMFTKLVIRDFNNN